MSAAATGPPCAPGSNAIDALARPNRTTRPIVTPLVPGGLSGMTRASTFGAPAMLPTRKLSALFACCLLALAFAPRSAWGQTTLLSENFESLTGAGIPATWTIATGAFDDTTANPSASGINTSANVLIADSLSARVATPVLNLDGLVGSTFILEFDLYNPTQTTSHGLIIGYGQSGFVDVWAASSNLASGPLGGGQILFNLTSAATWQHFSIDVTSWVTAYDSGPGDLSLFTLSFQDWSTPTLVMSSLDNVTLTAVPEPSTYAALFGFGALVFAAWRRRQTA